MEDKINKLQELFNQRAQVNREIESLLAGESQPKAESKKEVRKYKKRAKKEAPKEKNREIKPKDIKEIQAMKDQGFSSKDIAERLNLSLSSVNIFYAPLVKEKL